MNHASIAPRRKHCAFCGDEIAGDGVERSGKVFCCSWHADHYRPPPPWWKRLLTAPPDDKGGGSCCA